MRIRVEAFRALWSARTMLGPKNCSTVWTPMQLSAWVSPIIVGGAIDYALRGRRVGMLRCRQRHPCGSKPAAKAPERKELRGHRDPKSAWRSWHADRPDGTGRGSIGLQRDRTRQRQTRMEIQILTSREDIEALGEEIDAALAGVELRAVTMCAKATDLPRSAGAQDRNFALLLAIVFCVPADGHLVRGASSCRLWS
ncbi:MAG: hypothetical protein R3E66_03075 [bacterium]